MEGGDDAEDGGDDGGGGRAGGVEEALARRVGEVVVVRRAQLGGAPGGGDALAQLVPAVAAHPSHAVRLDASHKGGDVVHVQPQRVRRRVGRHRARVRRPAAAVAAAAERELLQVTPQRAQRESSAAEAEEEAEDPRVLIHRRAVDEEVDGRRQLEVEHQSLGGVAPPRAVRRAAAAFGGEREREAL